MAKYTTELRSIVESGFDLDLKHYPILHEEHRGELNNKIINHFYFREIAFETVPMFKFFLNRKLNEIMPFYNEMYASSELDYNPLWNIDIKETFNHNVENIGNSTTTGTNILDSNTVNTENGSGDSLNVESDTPQGNLSESDIRSNKYANATSHSVNSDSNNSTSNVDNTETTNSERNDNNNQNETYTRITEGASAGFHAPIAIKQWRDIMVNIDMQIIEELESLFISLW